MGQVLQWVGNLAGIAGIVFCLFAGMVRLAGQFQFLGYEVRTLFLGGIALMVMACLIKLYQLER